MDKIGRNDPCPCGSGKKYKQCCLMKKGGTGSGIKRKLTAKWLNPKVQKEEGLEEKVDLMERAFGNIVPEASFKPISPKRFSEGEVKKSEEKKSGSE